jgi:RNA-directed DNA polymerase
MSAPSKYPTLAKWRAYFASRGIEAEVAQCYLDYIRPLSKRDIPVIFHFEHMAGLLGRRSDYLASVCAAPESFYRQFKIKKRSGGFREISAPHTSLRQCQKWISDHILSSLCSKLPPCVTAYRDSFSILNHTLPHVGKNEVVLLDIKNFFPSITKRRVIGFFSSLGYNLEVSIALASICCLHNSLPQGSPASPSISNLLCSTMDRRIIAISRRFRLRYSRYADDICISGKVIPNAGLEMIKKAVIDSGFIINSDKTRRFSPACDAKLVTGVLVGLDGIRLPKSMKRNLRTHMHFILRFGYLSHIQKIKESNLIFLLRLRGQLEFWRFLEPNCQEVSDYIDKISTLQETYS